MNVGCTHAICCMEYDKQLVYYVSDISNEINVHAILDDGLLKFISKIRALID